MRREDNKQIEITTENEKGYKIHCITISMIFAKADADQKKTRGSVSYKNLK
jgi:hypothetical protein